MKNKLRTFLVQLAYLPQVLSLVWAATSRLTVAWVILLAMQGLLPALTVYLVRWLVDTLAVAVDGGASPQTIELLLVPALLMGGSLLLGQLLQGLSNWVRAAQSELVRDHISARLHEKAVAVDLAFYETPEYHDHLHRAQSEAGSRTLALLESMGGLFQSSITLLAMVAVLLPYGIWMPIALLLGTVPAVYVVFVHNRRYHHWWQTTTAERRKAEYYEMLMTNSVVAPELRLFDLGPHFRSAYQRIRQHLRTRHLQLVRDQAVANLGVSATALLVLAVAMAWMGWRALQGIYTLGDLALFYQAVNKGQGLLRVLVGNLGQLYANSLFLESLFTYLALESAIKDPVQPSSMPSGLTKAIRFRNVTFRYPGSVRPALQNFNLDIPAARVVAIVGANGAGKTTLVKLLCRFYDPEAGAIELDGMDIRNLSVQTLRRQITVLFQFPVPYHTTAAQNIAMGDLAATPTLEEVTTAAKGAGAHEVITALPQGYETLLGKWFSGGTELSGGEWQRIALARAFLRRAQIIILDEPTSAMDSWAENDWLARFRRLAQGRTAIVITHRFTTAMRADIIYVMDQGRIVEAGTHAELLEQGGLYAQSWTAQTRTGSADVTTESTDVVALTPVAHTHVRNGIS